MNFRLLLVLFGLMASVASAQDKPTKEPKYVGAPRYCLLVLDEAGKDRVWLVHDGKTLYMDKNGNGDLTEADEKIAAKAKKVEAADGSVDETFEVGQLVINGRKYVDLSVGVGSLNLYAQSDVGKMPYIKEALAKDKQALYYGVRVDAARPGIKGGGVDGRVSYMVGPFDLNGVLLFQPKVENAPVINLGSQYELQFFAARPELVGSRGIEFVLALGCPGTGPGTFAMVIYEGTIPKDVKPVAEVTVPIQGGQPLKRKYELGERC